MTNVERVKNLHSIALALAPSLRDKFDFSLDAQYNDWAKLAFKGAEALLSETEARLVIASKADFELQQRVAIEQERQNRLAQPATGETK